MKKVAVLFHDGFEEVEALSVVDIMRRANVECTMVGMDKLIENEDKRFFPLFDDHLTLPQKFPCHNKLFSQLLFHY